MNAPEPDVLYGLQHGLQFSVCWKLKPRNPWQSIANLDNLAAAMKIAGENVPKYHEVGVFLETESGGFLYWTSTMPDTFNSVGLRRATHAH